MYITFIEPEQLWRLNENFKIAIPENDKDREKLAAISSDKMTVANSANYLYIRTGGTHAQMSDNKLQHSCGVKIYIGGKEVCEVAVPTIRIDRAKTPRKKGAIGVLDFASASKVGTNN